jgi:hypothetical protein
MQDMKKTLKRITNLLALGFLGAFITSTSTARAADDQAATTKPYPLDTCVVSGEKLGEMGTPYVFTHEGSEIKLCCKGCLKGFQKEPAKFIKKIEAAGKDKAAGHQGHSSDNHQH